MVRKHNYFIPMDDENTEGLSFAMGLNYGLDTCETSMSVNEA